MASHYVSSIVNLVKSQWYEMARRIDDLVCSFSAPVTGGLDSMSVLVLGWLSFFLVSFVGIRVFKRFNRDRSVKSASVAKTELENVVDPSVSNDNAEAIDVDFVSKVKCAVPFRQAVSQRATSNHATARSAINVSPVAGDDFIQSQWIATALQHLYGNRDAINSLVQSWISSLNEQAQEQLLSTGVNLKFVELLNDSTRFELSSVRTEVLQDDSLRVTAECQGQLCLLVRVLCHRSGDVDNDEPAVSTSTVANDDDDGSASGDSSSSLSSLRQQRRQRQRRGSWRPHCEARVQLSATRLCVTVLQRQQVAIGRLVDAEPQVEILSAGGECAGAREEWSPLQQLVDVQCIGAAVALCVRQAVTNFYYSGVTDWPPAGLDPAASADALRSAKPAQPSSQPVSLQSNANFRCQSIDPSETDTGSGERVCRRLLVRVVKAHSLNVSPDAAATPYCTVELDEPVQRFCTQPASQPPANPFWNEEFIFDLSTHSSEILFELFDSGVQLGGSVSPTAGSGGGGGGGGRDGFLGLGVVGLDELLWPSTSQRQIISLLDRAGSRGTVTGALTVEFSFFNELISRSECVNAAAATTISDGAFGGAAAACGASSERQKSQRVLPSGQVLQTVRTTYSRPASERNTDYVTSLALNDLKTTAKPNATKSTLIIHSSKKVIRNEDGMWVEVSMKDDTASIDGAADDTAHNNDHNCDDDDDDDDVCRLRVPVNTTHMSNTSDGTVAPPGGGGDDDSLQLEPAPDSELSNGKSGGGGGGGGGGRSNGFMRSLRKHISASMRRPRPDSAGKKKRDAKRADSAAVGQKGSAEVGRARSLQPTGSPAAASHSRQQQMTTPVLPRRSGGLVRAGSSLTNVSTGSADSDSSYNMEGSTLVLEAKENGISRHFMVPQNQSISRRLRKKFIKLHIFNEHIFVAKHRTNRTCGVCARPLSQWLGKQAYECRQCLLTVHRACHTLVPADTVCPDSTYHTLQIEDVSSLTDKRLRNMTR